MNEAKEQSEIKEHDLGAQDPRRSSVQPLTGRDSQSIRV
jgi:hypothetical protein